MNFADIILLIIIGIAVFFALRTSLRRRKKGSACCGDCSRCGGSVSRPDDCSLKGNSVP